MFNQLSRDIHAPGSAKQLSELITDIPIAQIYGPIDAPVSGITSDSRKVKENWVFVAVEGEHSDGHNFIQQAIEKGASCVVIQLKQYDEYLSRLLSPAYAQHTQTTVVVVRNTREAVSLLAMTYYDHPANTLTMVGVTGTNGKTTTCYFLKNIFEAAGQKTGLLGTIEYIIGEERIPSGLTTPMAEEIQEMLARMVKAGCTHCVMEVSSHALALNRVYGMQFDAAIYTNLSRDHLDFHGSFENYAEAKALLFSRHSRGYKILNSDDRYQLQIWKGMDDTTVTYGTQGSPDILIRDVEASVSGLTCTLDTGTQQYPVKAQVSGSFNAGNIAAAFGVAWKLGVDPSVILDAIANVHSVPGRLQRVANERGISCFVDYSHTPDSLEKALTSLRQLLPEDGKLCVVFGCGGDRDKGKRPVMGEIAERLADTVILTNDNPRSEEPQAILDEILSGIGNTEAVRVLPDRKEAIVAAVAEAHPGDVILIAGKGHETYQINGTVRSHFSDVEVAEEALGVPSGGGAK